MPIGPASEPLVLEDDTLLYFNELRVEDPHRIVGTRCETRDRGATFCECRAGAVFQLPDEISIDLESPRSYWGQCEQFVYQYGFLREGETVWTLLGAHCKGGIWCRLMLFRRADGARTFDYVSTIGGATDPGHGGFTEPTMARMTDGFLLVVSRTEYPRDDWRYLASFRSSDDGVTWEEEGVPDPLPAAPAQRGQCVTVARVPGEPHRCAGFRAAWAEGRLLREWRRAPVDGHPAHRSRGIPIRTQRSHQRHDRPGADRTQSFRPRIRCGRIPVLRRRKAAGNGVRSGDLHRTSATALTGLLAPSAVWAAVAGPARSVHQANPRIPEGRLTRNGSGVHGTKKNGASIRRE